MIALCSKCYFIDDRGEKKKFSTKGMSKKQNNITWQRFKTALGRKQGYGNKQRVSNAGWEYSNLRTGEAGVECLL